MPIILGFKFRVGEKNNNNLLANLTLIFSDIFLFHWCQGIICIRTLYSFNVPSHPAQKNKMFHLLLSEQ